MEEHIVRDDEQPTENAQLAALADGSLSAERRRALEDQVAASPELESLLAEQQLAVSLVHNQDVTAPAALRARVGELTRAKARRAPRAWRPRLVVAGVAAAVAVVAVLAAALPGGAGGPTVVQAADLSQLSPTLPAPPRSAAHGDLLAASEAGVPYPDWESAFAWRATGERIDTLAGRHTTTVYYTRGGRRIGYSIVAGQPLSGTGGWRTAVHSGVLLHIRQSGGLTVVTWERGEHSCVLSGRGVRAASLEALASWHGESGTLYR
jgi:anti-sigma factor RsiW